MACNLIVMIADGLGFNGWLASDYYWHGRAAANPYQQALPGVPRVCLGMSHGSLRFVDATGHPVAHDGSLLPAGAVGFEPQHYEPERRWERFEGSFAMDFPPVAVPYASYTDSAAAATALFSGRTTTDGRLNHSWDGTERFTTIAELARRAGLGAGVVSTVQACHATPAGVMAHSLSRNNLEAIFRELVGSGLEVVMGAGHPDYDDSGRLRDSPDHGQVGGGVHWGELQLANRRGKLRLMDHRDQFEQLAAGVDLPHRVVGIPRAGNTLQAYRKGFPADDYLPDGMARNPAVPDLATLSRGALNVLNQRDDGFFLLVEGGAVDWMNHGNRFPRMLEEHEDFNRAVVAVMNWITENTSWEETLLVVTADHECGGLWGEGSFRPHPEWWGYHPDLTPFLGFQPVANRGRGILPAVQYATGNHTSDLVPLWAMGRGADGFLDRVIGVDPMAARLWGEGYGWDGRYVHTTDVFRVLRRELQVATTPHAEPVT